MRNVSFENLDELLKHFDDGYSISHDEAYRRFAEICLLPPSDLPQDPFSPEYRARYMDLYKKISQRPQYSVQNERSEFDVEKGAIRPYPYFTRSLKRAAQHYTLMGKLMEIMDVNEGASLLECGFGWGNTTIALAMLGYNVTALDIEERYCKVVRRRADMLKIDNIEIVNSDFLWVEQSKKEFDAVIFFESFHHCWEFERLLVALHKVIKPGGKIYFGAEPINEDFTVPWGIRLDGESLFVARRAGWMELGFHSDFFEELLMRTGWRGQCVHPHFWVAARKDDPIIIEGCDPRLKSHVGKISGSSLKIEAPGTRDDRHYGAFGPYISLGKGRYGFELNVSAEGPFQNDVVFDICCNSGQVQLFSKVLNSADCESGYICGEFFISERISDLEMRLNVPGGFIGRLGWIKISCLD